MGKRTLPLKRNMRSKYGDELERSALCVMYRVPSHKMVKSAVSSPSESLLCLDFGLLGVGGIASALETGGDLSWGVLGSALPSGVPKNGFMMGGVVVGFGADQGRCLAQAHVIGHAMVLR